MSNIKLSICIPTYNRPQHLRNCLRSIASNIPKTTFNFQVCVSDNGSPDNGETTKIVQEARQQFPIVYNRNQANLGIPRNFLKVVDMAEGEFVWLLGDDDLIFPHTIETICELITTHPGVDHFYINSCHLSTEFVMSFPQPFDTIQLPANMSRFSSRAESGEMPFLELIDPSVSFDFLGGMFLSVFRRKNWNAYKDTLDPKAIVDTQTFSHFDNTFPHVKIFSQAFAHSQSYFHALPLSICLSGAREWSPMYPLVQSIRLVEALKEYRKNGLKWIQYIKCKNYALNDFIPHLALMFLKRSISGYYYINPAEIVLRNCVYPNFYLSFFNYFIRKLRRKINAKRA